MEKLQHLLVQDHFQSLKNLYLNEVSYDKLLNSPIDEEISCAIFENKDFNAYLELNGHLNTSLEVPALAAIKEFPAKDELKCDFETIRNYRMKVNYDKMSLKELDELNVPPPKPKKIKLLKKSGEIIFVDSLNEAITETENTHTKTKSCSSKLPKNSHVEDKISSSKLLENAHVKRKTCSSKLQPQKSQEVPNTDNDSLIARNLDKREYSLRSGNRLVINFGDLYKTKKDRREEELDKENEISLKTIEKPTVTHGITDEVIAKSVSNLKCPVITQCKYRQRIKLFHSKCFELKKYSLGMLVHLGIGRCLSSEAINNMNLLYRDTWGIDNLRAQAAVSTLFTKYDVVPKVTRIITPVVSTTSVVDCVKRTMPSNVFVSNEVKEIVHDMVDYVERVFECPIIDFDPFDTYERMSFPNTEIYESFDQGTKCNNSFCLKGCICECLNIGKPPENHCRAVGCMFGCICKKKSDKTTPIKLNKFKVPKPVDEGLYKLLGKDPKRGRKIPKTLLKNPENSKTDKDPKSFKPESDTMSIVSGLTDYSFLSFTSKCKLRQELTERKLQWCANQFIETQTLLDVFIWCDIHNKYGCNCMNKVLFSKHNLMLWKSESKFPYLSSKLMSTIRLSNHFSFEADYYNTNEHCARTFGSLIDYKKRNQDGIFKRKREIELEQHVFVYSNGYIKKKLGNPGPLQNCTESNALPYTRCELYSQKNDNLTLLMSEEMIEDI